MTDDLTIRRPQDPTKINIHEEWEVRYWTNKWNVTRQQLIDAVRVAGTSAAAVARQLRKPL